MGKLDFFGHIRDSARRTARLLVIFALIVSGCLALGERTDDGNGEVLPEAEPKAPSAITLMLDGPPNALHAFIYAADRQGYFTEQGLTVRLQVPEETADPLRWLAAGKADLVLADQPGVVLARSRQHAVQSIAALIPRPLHYLLVPVPSPVHTPKHLDGLTVGYVGRTGHMILQTMLEHDEAGGIAPERTPLLRDAASALLSRQADAVVGGFVLRDSLYLEKSGMPARSVDPRLYGVPDYYGLVLAANEEGIRDRRDAYQKVLKALDLGRRFVMEHPEQGVRYVMEAAGADALDYELELQTLHGIIGLWSDPARPFGAQDEGTWKDVAKWLEDFGALRPSAVVDEIFVDFGETEE